MRELAILIPTLGRPAAIADVLASIEESTPPGIYCVYFVLDVEDDASHRAVAELARPHVAVLVEDGTYPRKVNTAAAVSQEPWVFVTADDVRFHPGWWEATAEARGTEGVGVIGTNDLHNRHVQRGEYATQFLIARWYVELGTIDEPGKVFHEGYHHNCVDVELSETAMARRAWRLQLDSTVEHLHHLYGGREVDETDRKGNLRDRDRDRALLRERRKLWAPAS